MLARAIAAGTPAGLGSFENSAAARSLDKPAATGSLDKPAATGSWDKPVEASNWDSPAELAPKPQSSGPPTVQRNVEWHRSGALQSLFWTRRHSLRLRRCSRLHGGQKSSAAQAPRIRLSIGRARQKPIQNLFAGPVHDAGLRFDMFQRFAEIPKSMRHAHQIRMPH